MANRVRILISAYACEPGKGSEPGVGWHVSTEMAHHFQVTVLTRANNREVIEKALAKVSGPKPDFIYYDLPGWVMWLKRKTSLISVYYTIWQFAVRWRLRDKISEYNLIHHVTFNGFQLPGFWIGTDCQVVLGPLGGGMVYPPNFVRAMGSGWISEKLRGFVVKLSTLNPLTRMSLCSADKVLAANRETAKVIGNVSGERPELMLETGYRIDVGQGLYREPDKEDDLIKVLWVGGLVPRKAPLLAIEATRVAIKRGARIRLDIVGGGPLEGELRRLASGADSKWLVCHGQVPHEETRRFFAQADVFLFTSLRDTSGNVVLEAMAHGLPVVVPDHQGVALICSEDQAIKVPVDSPKQLLDGIADALVRLSTDSGLRQSMGKRSRDRLLSHWSWEGYGRKMGEIYQKCLSVGAGAERE